MRPGIGWGKMQIPIISGIATRGVDFSSAYPVNLIPVPKVQGISEGYLRPAEGIVSLADGAGANRGGVRWRDRLYRVMGNRFLAVEENGALTDYGFVGGYDWATFTASFDYLAINAGGNIYLFDGTTLQQITDVDLGTSLDVEWINGYFMSTDGDSLIVTDLGNPFSVNPLKYGSSEISPDPVVSLQKLRNEVYAVNRYTVEVFAAVLNPGSGFPFARVEGAQIMKGAVGSRACCEFMQRLAFLGGGENEPPAIWLGMGGDAQKLSTREIDDALRGYEDDVLASVVLESRVDRSHEFLLIHLPDQTLVFDGAGTQAAGQPVWFVLRSGTTPGGYRARGFVWCYNRWNVADPFGTKIGYLSDDELLHYGDAARWEFTTPILYKEGRGAQIHELELVALTGDIADGVSISTQYSLDGAAWSQPRYAAVGKRSKRISWTRQGSFRNWRIQRFAGDSRAHLSFARLEARVEDLAW